MLSITLRQIRSGWVRLIAAGLAIMLGTGFITASILGGNVMKEATFQSLTRDFRGWDILVSPIPGFDDAAISPELTGLVAATPGIKAVENKARFSAFIDDPTHPQWVPVGAVEADSSDRLTEGSIPRLDGEAALSEKHAALLGVGIGDDIVLTVLGNAGSGEDQTDLTYRISGLLSDLSDFFVQNTLVLLNGSEFASPELEFATSLGPLAVQLAANADTASTISALKSLLGDQYDVTTVSDHAQATLTDLTGESDIMRNLLLGFAAIALVVAILVVSNTFAVLVAQRTNCLALLRTIGASRGQVRSSVLLEAIALGLVASAAGVFLGFGIIAAAIAWISSSLPGIDLWKGAALTPQIWLITLIVGTLITLLGSWGPARAATKVRPLEALRPRDPELGTTAGKFRALIASLAFLTGAILLVGGLLLRTIEGSATTALLLGITGGFISVVGIIFGSVFLISPIVRLMSKPFGVSVPATVATMGAVRNPRRTATTTNALFIGVALVAMMSTGAATAKSTLDNLLSETFYSDMQAFAQADPNGAFPPISTAQIDGVRSAESIAMVAALAEADAVLPNGVTYQMLAPLESYRGANPAPVEQTFRNPAAFAALNEGEAIVPGYIARANDLQPGDPLEVVLNNGEATTLRVGFVEESIPGILLTKETFLALSLDPAPRQLMMELSAGADASAALSEIQELLAATPGGNLQVISGAIEREGYTTAVDMLLLIVNALLGVAVVIALVGVANTLSLSVIERRRESATLRALGLTTGQLRASLAIEGSLIALVGTVTGVLGGLIYGWAGAFIMLSGIADFAIAVPWGTIGIVLLVAVVAGVLASVIPARAAVRVSPVAALAEQ